MDNICKYCNKTFAQEFNLYKHQRSAKYCLKIQGKLAEIAAKYSCKWCKTEFSRLDNLKRHENKCGSKEQNVISCDWCGVEFTLAENLEKHKKVCTAQIVEHFSRLEKNITDLSNNRHVTMNMPALSEDDIRDNLVNLTIDIIQDGGKGYANYADYYMFKDRVLCTDKARKKLQYRDANGEIVKDHGGLKLTQRFFQTISKRNEELIKAEYKVLQEQVQDIAQAGRAHRSDITGLLNKSTKLQDLLIKCKDAASGKENDLTREFVNHLSKLL